MPDHKNLFIMYILIGFSVLFLILPTKVDTFIDELPVTVEQVYNWATKFGNEINIGSTRATCYETISNNYNEMGAKAVGRDAQKLVEEMVTDIENMFQWKTEHVRRIAERAEELAANHTLDSNLNFEYYNAKKVYSKADESYVDMMLEKDKVNLKYLEMHPNQLFKGLPVNFEESVVHVPINVYEEQPALKKQIKWSLSLRDVFRNNRVVDPDIYWQYSCSSSGFMRLYPAARWRIPEFLKTPDFDRKPLDLYDCRLKQWFIRAAASSKDIVILLDGSGSMLGQRKEIARNVVINILDTLTEDDYVTVLRFSNIIEPVVSCFGPNLVEANPQNLMLIKQQLTLLNTTDIANFTLALRTAFEILKEAKSSNSGENDLNERRNTANCNQAIMLVTDGAPDNDRLDHEAIFAEYNWPNIDIRVFSYLVGKEVTETKETNWMACRNRGFYTQISNLAEIREQVQLYLPVMSRPLVLSRNRIIAYSGVYSDIVDVPLNNWVWSAREREKIRQSIKRKVREASMMSNNENYQIEGDEMEESEDGNEEEGEESAPTKETKQLEINQKSNKTKRGRFSKISNYLSNKLHVNEISRKFKRWSQGSSSSNYNNQDDYTYGQDGKNTDDDTEGNDFDQNEQIEESKVIKKKQPELMMTIAAPVFDIKNETEIIEKYLEKNVWKTRLNRVKSANLLGVAGVDVPIREIKRYTPAYRLGVNGYSFVINNNGHILFHPELRVLFQDLLKPYYGSVDLTEVELEDNDENPRARSRFNQLRSNMINRQISWKTIPVKLYLDTMKRVVTRNQTYWTSAIKNTPFSLAVVLPETYGKVAISGQIEFKRKDEDYKKYFSGDKWRVHPDWVYCDDDLTSKNEGNGSRTPEKRILMFLQKASQSNIRWKSPSLSPQVYEELTCNKDLVQSLIFDAKATDINLTTCGEPTDLSRYERDISDKFGINLTFVATRSGFSRFEDFYSSSWVDYDVERQKENLEKKYENESLYDPVNDSENLQEEDEGAPFRDAHNKAIDEVFYKRAVDFHSIDSNAFVFGVPFNAHRKPEQVVKVTGSKAIFIGSNNKKAPAAVVGLQIQLNQFADRFFNTTKKCNGKTCENQCARLGSNSSSDLNCFLIDNNGYVVVSRDHDQVGRHFGEIDYNLFTTLLENNVYRAVRMYDYQAICIELINKFSLGGSSSKLSNLFIGLFNIQKFIFTFLLDLLVITFDFLSNIRTADAYLQADVDAEDLNYNPTMFKGVVKDAKEKYLPPNRTRPYTCDKEFYLYEINQLKRQELLTKPIKKEYNKCEEPCVQNFIISAVQNTNLLLLVYKDVCHCDPIKVRIIPKNIIYENDCDIAKHHKDTERVRLSSCVNYNPHEEDIKQCGDANSIMPNLILIILITILIVLLHNNIRVFS